jgi:hypothetical protein
LILRDDKEEARAGNLDHRFNHWTAVRDALMGEHADIFPQVRAIVKTLPTPIDQMKFFELIQIIPSPIRSALKSGDLVNYRISDPRIMGYLRNNSIFALDRPTEQEHLRPFVKFLMQCGSSIADLNERFRSSTS